MKGNHLSRRDFLRFAALTTGIVAAGCGAPGGASNTASTAASADGTADASDAAPEALAEASEAAFEPAPPEQGVIALWGWWDQRMALYNEAAQAFATANPGVQVKVENFPGDEQLVQKIFSAIAAGTGPTLLKMGEFLFDMRDQNLLVEFPAETFPDSWFEATYPGFDYQAYGRLVVPTGISPIVMVYNKRLFEEAGLDPNTPPKTLDELVEAAKKLTKTDSSGLITQAGFVPSNEFTELDYIYQRGGNIVTTEGGKQVSTMNSPEVVQSFQWVTDLATTHKVWDPDFPVFIEAVGTGTGAMTIGEAYIVGEFKANYPDIFSDLAVVAPATPSGDAAPYWGRKSTVLDLSVVAGRPEEYDTAFRFLEYLYNQDTEAMYKLVDLIAIAPEHAKLIDDSRVTQSPTVTTMVDVATREYDPIQPKGELDQIMTDARDRVLLAGEDVQASLEAAHGEWQRILDDGLAKYFR